ncbi:hypothetical protein Zmor_021557 [Zophobas morio]|uniref:Ricin B lectin domain-containing protein n=2 Tax=Zophobas morio TaxID=2755281 RepID=A0AA38MB44_9CUCU|nr:hypothetical protein Zmor_021557 [Zophobas morio]
MTDCSSSLVCHSLGEHITPSTLVKQNTQWYPENYNSIIIVNPASSLVLDASQYHTQLQQYTGSPLQLWRFERTETGNFLIKNVGNQRYLQVQGDATNGKGIFTEGKSGGPSQQWQYNHLEQTITNSASGRALDIQGFNFIAGAGIEIYDKHAGTNQRFSLQYK